MLDSSIHNIPAVMALDRKGWFGLSGAYVLVDGQYGSTGKGLMASILGVAGAGQIKHVTTNAGPNSGHTGFFNLEKIVTRQLPVASVVMGRMGHRHICSLNAGAIIDPAVLDEEIERYLVDSTDLVVHPHAAVIEDCDRVLSESTQAIASTGKGVGEAMARKVLRANPGAGKVITNRKAKAVRWPIQPDKETILIETAQGYSLGINAGFYPHCTSRECTVAQALADAAIHPAYMRKTIMTVRTFPIRVGNTDKGYSGDCYPDQHEISWEDIGVAPEVTTVTGRVRRVFTWSDIQFAKAIFANQPDAILLNFMNYLETEAEQNEMVDRVRSIYRNTLGRELELLLLGFGPFMQDVWAA